MKTTVEISDELFRRAKIRAVTRGETFRQLVQNALQEHLEKDGAASEQKPWMKHFGSLRHLHEESRRIDAVIDSEFEQIEPEDSL